MEDSDVHDLFITNVFHNLQKSDALNRQFQSVFSEPNKITATEFENNQYMQQKTAYPTMPDINITIQGISKLLLNLNPSKASGLD